MSSGSESVFWSVYARSYDNLAVDFRPYRDLVREVCDHVDEFAAGRSLYVLDAGCGTGNYSLELVRRGHRVVGLDNSAAMLTRARAKAREGADCRWVEHDLSRPLPFTAGSFDAAICVHVMYAMADPGALAAELRRVVGVEGRLVAVTLQKPVEVFGAVAEAHQRDGLGEAVKTVGALFGVGLCNLVISGRQKHGSYNTMSEAEFTGFLADHSFAPLTVRTTYTRGISVLAVASGSGAPLWGRVADEEGETASAFSSPRASSAEGILTGSRQAARPPG